MVSSKTDHATIVMWRPGHALLTAFPIVCFTLTLLTDIAYWQTSNLLWQHFSSWLLLAGLVMGGISVLGLVIDLLLGARFAPYERAWLYVLGHLLVLALAFINSLVHAGDGWTAVVPAGLALSLATVAVITFTIALSRSLVISYGRKGGDHA